MISKTIALSFSALLMCGSVWAEPSRPGDPSVVLARVAVQAGAGNPLRVLQAELAKDPKNLELAIVLARAAIEIGRNTADPRLYGQAEAALAPWWNSSEAPINVRLLRATIRQAFHQFDAALADLDAAIAAEPDNPQALFSRAFIHLTLGAPRKAERDCAALTGAHLQLFQAICAARVDALRGKGQEAADRLIKAIARERRATAAMKKFALAVLADIKTGLGDWGATTRYYQQVIAAGNADVAAVAAYADMLLAMNKPGEALALLEDQGEADIIILRRAIAAKSAGDPRLAGWQAILEDRFAANAASGNRVHLREEARFLLEVKENAAAALALAIENWAVQKEVADAEIMLRASLAAKQTGAALPVLDHLKSTGLKDVRLDALVAKLAVMGQAS